MNLANVENELNRMKAETLGDAGRKLGLLSEMIESKISYQERSVKIMNRLSAMLECRMWFFKRAKLLRVKEKLEKKIAKSAVALRNMKKRREVIYNNLIIQREALGITEHEWIDNFYMK